MMPPLACVSLDTSFDNDGMIMTDVGVDAEYATDVAIQPDGSLDTTFGGDGKVITAVAPGANADQAFGAALQVDGKIVLAGWAVLTSNFSQVAFGLARYEGDPTGTSPPSCPSYLAKFPAACALWVKLHTKPRGSAWDSSAWNTWNTR